MIENFSGDKYPLDCGFAEGGYPAQEGIAGFNFNLDGFCRDLRFLGGRKGF
jgi:hypothetical protein